MSMIGQLPAGVGSDDKFIAKLMRDLAEIPDNYDKFLFLQKIKYANEVLFYKMVALHTGELLPIIYTPTIADAVMNYSNDWIGGDNCVFLDVNQPEKVAGALEVAKNRVDTVDLMVITDGEGVLGIGDWGVGGAMIAVGKLTVYTVASGIPPNRVLPIVIDAGTNNQTLLEDPNYLGNRHQRVGGEPYLAFVDQFVTLAKTLFPKALFHWEDFGRDHAALLLERYQDNLCTFNDDIQGTGVMMVAAMEAACQVSKVPLAEQRTLIFGGGTAGIGIADQLVTDLVLQGMSVEVARKAFYIVDRDGLVIEGMPGLTPGQARYARSHAEFPDQLQDLLEIVQKVKPSVLIGSSAQAGAFTQAIVEEMARLNERPIIMPISNPSSRSEAKAEDVIRWTKGKGLVVTGSPTPDVTYEGVTYRIGQANNALLYPGLGFGIVIAGAERVTDGMLSAAAHAMTSLQALDKLGSGLLPEVSKLRQASKLVAAAVIRQAQAEDVATNEIIDVEAAIEANIWQLD